ncbi:MAG TPA: hypothetical protein VH814_20570 [Steroidobacteraceae bacterium]|jgi:hypothetical protein
MTHNEHIGFSGAHGECWNLLPWIANESAATKDVARVEAHLRDCRECQQELEFQRQLRHAIRSEEAVLLAPQTSLQKLMQRIDTVEDIDDEPEAAPAEVVAMPRARAMRWSRLWPIAAAVQGVAITGLLAAMWMQSDALTAPRYNTQTSHAKAMTHRPVIRIVFTGNLALDDMNRVLRAVDAQIIAGPSEAGVYTIGAARFADAAKVDEALAQLRADNHVRFAEPADEYEAP